MYDPYSYVDNFLNTGSSDDKNEKTGKNDGYVTIEVDGSTAKRVAHTRSTQTFRSSKTPEERRRKSSVISERKRRQALRELNNNRENGRYATEALPAGGKSADEGKKVPAALKIFVRIYDWIITPGKEVTDVYPGLDEKVDEGAKAAMAADDRLIVRTVVCFLAVFVLVGGGIFCRAQYNSISNKVSKAQNDLAIAQGENIRLKSELTGMYSADEIDNYACNVLGMVKCSSSRISYVDLGAADRAAKAQALVETSETDSGSGHSISSLWNSLMSKTLAFIKGE